MIEKRIVIGIVKHNDTTLLHLKIILRCVQGDLFSCCWRFIKTSQTIREWAIYPYQIITFESAAYN